MGLADYIEALKRTKTYKSGVIKVQEYSFESRWGGLQKRLPSVPHADRNRHVVVMGVLGDQPIVKRVLTDPEHVFHTTTKDVDKLLFIFVEMRPDKFAIDKIEDGYHLGDGHRIDAKFTVAYKIKDAKEFWNGNRDPLGELETSVIDAATNFFLSISSHYLISNPGELKAALQEHIHNPETKIFKTDLENRISSSCSVAGIDLLKVIADVYMSESLRDYLKRIHDRIYGVGGAAERSKVDQLIDSDTTFAPFKLREVIMHVDMTLLENFYSMEWGDAMRRVTEKVAEMKRNYVDSLQDIELIKFRKLKDMADELGLDEMKQEDLKDVFFKKLLTLADADSKPSTLTDVEYLSTITALSPSGPLLSDTARTKK